MDRVKIKPKNRPRRFYVLDGHALIHRAYHSPTANLSCPCPECNGSGNLRFLGRDNDEIVQDCFRCNGTGEEPTKAIYVFTRALLKLCREHKPDYLVFAHDACPREKLLRTKLYPEYKANRPKSDWELSTQMRRIKQIVAVLGVPMVHAHGYEADDVIATLVDAAKGLDDLETVIVSRDKDLAQLICEGVRMYDPLAEEFLDGRWAYKKFGVHPAQVSDWLAMVGDPGDNVKGVPGIGEKGATEILLKHTTAKRCVEWMVEQLSHSKDAKFSRPELLLKTHWKAFDFAKQLTHLETDVEIEGIASFHDLEFTRLDVKQASPIFRTLGFKRWE